MKRFYKREIQFTKIILPTKKQNVKKTISNLKRYIFYHIVLIKSTIIFVHCIDTFVTNYLKITKYSTKQPSQMQCLCGFKIQQRKIDCINVLSTR